MNKKEREIIFKEGDILSFSEYLLLLCKIMESVQEADDITDVDVATA